jgi:hypothetical protein
MITNQMIEESYKQKAETIREKITRFGFTVKSIETYVDAKSSPEVGFVVTLVDREVRPAKEFLEWLLHNYAHRIVFNSGKQPSEDGMPAKSPRYLDEPFTA